MKTLTGSGRVKNPPAEERAGDAGASPKNGENETEDDNRPPGAGDGAGQKWLQVWIAGDSGPGMIRQECRHPMRGWS